MFIHGTDPILNQEKLDMASYWCAHSHFPIKSSRHLAWTLERVRGLIQRITIRKLEKTARNSRFSRRIHRAIASRRRGAKS